MVRSWPARAVARAALLGATIALLSSEAHAQTPEQLAAARQVFDDGKRLEEAESWALALDRFNAVARVRMTPQVRFHIALCEENLGRLVNAIKGFDSAAEEAKAAGPSALDVTRNAPRRAAALRARVATLQINVRGDVEAATVSLDGMPMSASTFGNPTLVEPGHHVVELRREGEPPSRREVSLAAQDEAKVELGTDSPPHLAGPRVAPPPPRFTPSPARTPPPAVARPSRLPAILSGTVGVAAFAVAGAFWALRQDTITDVLASCKQPQTYAGCNPTLRETADRGRTDTAVSEALIGVGIVGVAAAGVLFVWTPMKGEARSSAGAGPTFEMGVSPAGVEATARF